MKVNYIYSQINERNKYEGFEVTRNISVSHYLISLNSKVITI